MSHHDDWHRSLIAARWRNLIGKILSIVQNPSAPGLPAAEFIPKTFG
jgi:hypothetical protein